LFFTRKGSRVDDRPASAAKRPPDPLPAILEGFSVNLRLRTSPSDLDESSEIRRIFSSGALSAQWSAKALASVVLPTPPLPPKKCRTLESIMRYYLPETTPFAASKSRIDRAAHLTSSCSEGGSSFKIGGRRVPRSPVCRQAHSLDF